MNKPSVEQAFSITAPAQTTVGAFVWNAAGTEVSLTPADKFPYNSDVTWSISMAARDLEGNALSEETIRTFSVIRTATVTLPRNQVDTFLVSTSAPPQATPWAIGDDANNQPYHGFVSFPFQPILYECDLDTTIVSAVLTWPYSDPEIATFNSLGRFLIDPVYYSITGNAHLYSRPSLGTPLSLNYQDFNVQSGSSSIAVTNLVADAWNDRGARGDKIQFRLKFETTTDNDNSSDAFQINPDNMYLKVICEQP
jgi:hypothetical protein